MLKSFWAPQKRYNLYTKYDLILIVGKMHINYCKVAKKIPCIDGFKKQIENIKDVEKYIAIKNNNIHLFNKKWFIENTNP